MNLMKTTSVMLSAAVILGATYIHVRAEGPEPRCRVDDTRADLGTIFEADTYEHTFVVHNDGDAVLEILKVKPG